MLIKTLIKQGEKIIQQDMDIQQYKEENKSLRSEIEFEKGCREWLVRDILNLIADEEKKKTPYVFIIDKIKNVLDNDRNIANTNNKFM